MEPLFHLEGMAMQEVGDENEFDGVQLDTLTLAGRMLAVLFVAIVLTITILALGYASGAGLAATCVFSADYAEKERMRFCRRPLFQRLVLLAHRPSMKWFALGACCAGFLALLVSR